jgi:hypothetical protein
MADTCASRTARRSRGSVNASLVAVVDVAPQGRQDERDDAVVTGAVAVRPTCSFPGKYLIFVYTVA